MLILPQKAYLSNGSRLSSLIIGSPSNLRSIKDSGWLRILVSDTPVLLLIVHSQLWEVDRSTLEAHDDRQRCGSMLNDLLLYFDAAQINELRR